MKKKKVLIADPISHIGHVNYNYGIIKATQENYDVSLFTSEKMKTKLVEIGVPEDIFIYMYKEDDHDIAKLAEKYNQKKIVYHTVYRKGLLDIYKKIRQVGKDYDAIVMTSVDIYSFAPVSQLFKGNISVVDHAIGMVNDSGIYRAAWKACSNRVKLIVLEEFIRDMVQGNSLNKSVYVVHHPLPKHEFTQSTECSSTPIKVFAPSLSNDLAFIDSLKGVESDIDVIFTVRGATSYENRSLSIYNLRISDDDYNRLLQTADFILLPYEDNYNYRISAVLFEAAVRKKKVLIRNNNTLAKYAEKFPEQIYLFGTIEEMLEQIKNNFHRECSQYDLELYKDESIAASMKSVIGDFR